MNTKGNAGSAAEHGDIVIGICAECATARRRRFQESFTEEIQAGLSPFLAAGGKIAVKASFHDPQPGAIVEHMWVNVLFVDLANRQIVGILTNYPDSVKTLQAWQCVQVPFADIDDMVMKDPPAKTLDDKEGQGGRT